MRRALATQIDASNLAFPRRESTSDVNWQLGRRAVSLDVNLKQVVDDSGEAHAYSALVIATGLRPKQLDIARGLRGVHVLRTLDDAVALRGDLTPGAKVVILGSGFIGCEVAATANKLECSVTVVSSSRQPLERVLGADFAGEIQRRHEAHGVRFVFETDIADVSTAGSGKSSSINGLTLRNGERLECEVLVVAIGSIANTDWLADSQIDITDGVLTNNAMQALDAAGQVVADVYAIGDVARFANPLFDDVARRVEHWNIPSETAKRAAKVIAAGLANDGALTGTVAAETFAPLPSFWSDPFEMNILGFGSPARADEAKLLEGELSGDFIFGYYKQGRLVGVAGIGMKGRIQSYRTQFVLPEA
ncbi:MAG: hypothetical protein RL196_1561 [Actinomycetota bacterium]|jgi:NADPH-dependent 2,4-dienoyl-CoA reductase/sulfur reductase-like enzyme